MFPPIRNIYHSNIGNNIECATLDEPVPIENDCDRLALALAKMERTSPPMAIRNLNYSSHMLAASTFIVDVGSASSISGGTCEYAVINEAISNIEYCPGDLVSLILPIGKQKLLGN